MKIPGEPEIEKMGRYDQKNGKRKQNQLIYRPILLWNEKNHASGKKQKRHRTPVVPNISMTQGKHPNNESQEDHTCLIPEIMDDIDPEDG